VVDEAGGEVFWKHLGVQLGNLEPDDVDEGGRMRLARTGRNGIA
jgi:hypothetical protein